MRGYILAFRPGSGNGTIVADNGDTLRFARPCGRTDLSGGDIVSFRLAPRPPADATTAACDVELVERCSDHLVAADRALIRELYSALRPEQSAS